MLKNYLQQKNKEIDEMFIVGNMQFQGLANDKLTPDKLKEYFHQSHLELIEQVKKMCEESKKDLKWFEENHFIAEYGHPNYDKEADRWVGVTAKDCYNKALKHIISKLSEVDYKDKQE